MDCPNCGHENPEGNAFCENCGTPIEQAAGTAAASAGHPAEQALVPRQPADGSPQARQAGEAPQEQAERQPEPQPQPKKPRAGAVAAIVIGVAVAVAGAFFVINMQRQSEIPVVYGTFSDSRPASDDHGRFLSFQVDEDAASSAGRHFAVFTIEWAPGKYDLDGYEVELESDHIDIVARVELHDEGDKVAFTPSETLSDGIDWQVSGSFDKSSVTLEEGYWTIETPEGMSVPVYVDHLTLPYGNAQMA